MKNLVAQLREGKTQPEARKDLYELVASIGSPQDVAVLLEQGTSDKLDDGTRAAALRAAERAARQRKVTPPGLKAEALRAMFPSKDADLAAAAVRLAGALKLADAKADLESLVSKGGDVPFPVALAAAEGLAEFGKDSAGFFQGLTDKSHPPQVRALAVIGLSAIDAKQAAAQAADYLTSILPGATTSDLSDPVLAAFLRREGGADALAAALKEKKLPADVAKLSLRYLQGTGQTAPGLTEVLRTAAGLGAAAKELTPDEMKQLIAEVAAKGDPARGELVFRSKAAGCYQCHAIGAAGGPLAPDLRTWGPPRRWTTSSTRSCSPTRRSRTASIPSSSRPRTAT